MVGNRNGISAKQRKARNEIRKYTKLPNISINILHDREMGFEMRKRIKKAIEVTLILNEKEGKYLKGLVQNYLGDGDESGHDNKIRSDIWDALL